VIYKTKIYLLKYQRYLFLSQKRENFYNFLYLQEITELFLIRRIAPYLNQAKHVLMILFAIAVSLMLTNVNNSTPTNWEISQKL